MPGGPVDAYLDARHRRRWSAAAGAAPLQAQPDEEIILADPAFSLTFSAGYIASDLDLWGKHGIKVKTVQITGIGAINSVISGSSHFAQASASSFGRATARGQKLIAIATTIDRPFAQIVLRKEIAQAAASTRRRRWKSARAVLKGRTIAVDSINSMIHAYVRLIAARAGINPDDIRVAPMAPNSMLAAFQSKQIDGYAMSLPWPQKAVQDGEALLIASGPDGEPGDMIPFGHNLIVTRQDTCAQKKALCRAMGQSIKDATAFIKTKPDEAFALLKKRFPTLDDKLLKASFEELQKVTPSPPVVNRAVDRELRDVQRRRGPAQGRREAEVLRRHLHQRIREVTVSRASARRERCAAAPGTYQTPFTSRSSTRYRARAAPHPGHERLLLVDDPRPQHADVRDLDLQHVAGLHPERRLAAVADALRRAGGDDVAGMQRGEVRAEADDLLA